MEKLIRQLLGLMVLTLLLIAPTHTGFGSAAGDPLRIPIDQLKQMVGRSDVVVIDVRDPISWEKSSRKIRGAVREDPEKVTIWANKYSRDQTIVLYCA